MSPIFSITKGSLDATELAALTALVAATSQIPAQESAAPATPLCGAWGRPEEKFSGFSARTLPGLNWA